MASAQQEQQGIRRRERGVLHSPFWMLLVRLAAIADGMRAQLEQAIVELAMRPIELGIGRVTQAKRGKPHVVETARAEAGTAQGFPEYLAVGGQLALARGGYGDENDRVLQQLLLHSVNDPATAAGRAPHVQDRRRSGQRHGRQSAGVGRGGPVLPPRLGRFLFPSHRGPGQSVLAGLLPWGLPAGLERDLMTAGRQGLGRRQRKAVH